MDKYSYLKSVNADYIDEVFERYLEDPNSVDESWKFFFEGIEFGSDAVTREIVEAALATPSAPAPAPVPPATNAGGAGAYAQVSRDPTPAGFMNLDGEAKVTKLIEAYRTHGITVANINPLEKPAASNPFLELSTFGLTTGDLDQVFTAGKLIGVGPAKLRDLLNHLRETYCSTIGVEFTHIHDPEMRSWLQTRMESSRNQPNLTPDTKKYIYQRLSESESFERFLHQRYVAQKRFSLEGGESLIPMIDCMIEVGADQGATDFVMGMAHRGRLNVLTNIFGKKPEYMFTEFEANYKVDTSHGEGDVKYHKGYSTDKTTRNGKEVHLSLASNPSHLEVAGAIVEGVARAKQQRKGDKDRKNVVPIVMHGDAAFAGQGVCYEMLNLSQLEGFATGGTLHIVINNQVGFTTSVKDARSTRFSTDLALMLGVPIFHVNGDDPEACWHVAKLAAEFRQKFRKDVFIDLICYRKHGHNEGDEPTFTQPSMYAFIKAHASTREIYAQKLQSEGVMDEAATKGVIDQLMSRYLEAQAKARAENLQPYVSVFQGSWKAYRQPKEEELFLPVKTAVSTATLTDLATKLNQFPAEFKLHPKLARFFEMRLKAVQEGKGIDWGNAETLAYATLLMEGHPVRITGQDVERGTFSHRHAVLNHVETGTQYTPLNHLKPGQPQAMIHNSHLSEMAVLGFEHGYSLASPETLVIWEAQFGDFANSAQIIIDQFLSSSESKWQRMSGLTLLLPHGYEGQGPEHSSARLERFLQLCGRSNMFICNLTTPAQIFHALRRQMKWDFRKPLVVMSPKSLLRHPMAISTLKDLSEGSFQEVIDDTSVDAKAVRRVLLCTGKVYYDLLAKRTELGRGDVAILRLEQVYPFPAEALSKILQKFSGASDIRWVQEEPRNMGAWGFVFQTWAGGLSHFAEKIGNRGIRYIGREIGAAPAVGSPKLHDQEQKSLVDRALD